MFTLVSGGALATGLVPCVVVVEALADSLYDYGLDVAVRTDMRVSGRTVELQGDDAPPHVPELLVVESLDYLNEGDNVSWRELW